MNRFYLIAGKERSEKQMSSPYTYDANRSKVKYTDKTPYELDNPKNRRMLTPVNRYLLIALIAVALLLILFYLMGGFPH